MTAVAPTADSKVNPTTEKAVNDYLSFLEDPQQLRDEEAIAEKQAELEGAARPSERLRIQSELVLLEELPEEMFLAPFVKEAKNFIEQTGIDPRAFLKEGVKPSVLRDAGVSLKGVKAPKKKRAGRRHTVEDVIDHVIGHDWAQEGFPARHTTTKAMVQLTGASPATVSKAREKMIADGDAIKTNLDDPNHTGRGAKAKLLRITR